MMNKLFAILLCLSSFGLAVPVGAQDAYPSRAISIVVPFGPGSGTDVGARLIGQKLSEALGRPVTIDNKPGANGVIAPSSRPRPNPMATRL
jgi:tripartite-type tricarboxylate transporter receptor subunit TctC